MAEQPTTSTPAVAAADDASAATGVATSYGAASAASATSATRAPGAETDSSSPSFAKKRPTRRQRWWALLTCGAGDASMLVERGAVRKFPGGRLYDGRSLLLFGTKHPLRHALTSLVEDEVFDRLVLVVIVANCVTMALKDPLAPPGPLDGVGEWVCTGLFTAEMAIKVVAMGLTPLETSLCYLSDGWNCLDGFIVVVS